MLPSNVMWRCLWPLFEFNGGLSIIRDTHCQMQQLDKEILLGLAVRGDVPNPDRELESLGPEARCEVPARLLRREEGNCKASK
jgi:hypothetical protein